MTYIDELSARVLGHLDRDERIVVGLTGPPGAGKTTLAEIVVGALQARGVVAVHVPMDGFHLAEKQLRLLGLENRKGAIDTFDGYGYLGLIRRIKTERTNVVFAPAYERLIEEPVAGSIAVDINTRCILTEGNYLLAANTPWNEIHSELTEVWFLDLPTNVRHERLLARHIHYGKSMSVASAWVTSVDESNARLIAATRTNADLLVDMSRVESHLSHSQHA